MRSNTLGAKMAENRMQMVERGEKLGKLEDKTEKMMNDSENFSNAAHQLMLKYKDKKWYQLWAISQLLSNLPTNYYYYYIIIIQS